MINYFQGGDDKEKEQGERAASLVVLPPLILGYEELYVDNDDKPAKKDMDYPEEGTDVAVGQNAVVDIKYTDRKEEPDLNNEQEEEEKSTTGATTTTKAAAATTTTKKKEEKKQVKKDEKKDSKKDKKGKDKKEKKKDSKKKDKKKKNSKKKDKKKSKKGRKKKTKKKGKRRGRGKQTSESEMESNSESSSESSSESQNQSELSNDYDTIEINKSLDLLNSTNLDDNLSNQGFKNKTNVTTFPLSKLVGLVSRRKTKTRSGEKKGVITLKGQGEIGEGKEVVDFTGNFRVPKKVLDCPCFKEILENEKPAF